MTILIVDDRPTDLKLLRARLEAEGVTVSEATDGVEALGVLQGLSVDAIISDIQMPRMDGYRLCQEVRASPQSAEVPFIVYSATSTSPDDEKRMIEMGANRILQKPTSPTVFAGILDQIAHGDFRRPPALTRVRPEADQRKEYRERSVAKREEKNFELESKIERLTLAHLQLGDQLRQAQKMAALGMLAAGVAHDFNNILVAIYQYCELAREEAAGNALLTEYLEGLTCGAKRATALVRQILTFGGPGGEERRPIELWPIATEAVRLLRAALPATIEFQTSLEMDAPVVLADATEIYRILMNLGINAAHAMRERGGRLTVALEDCRIDAKFSAAHSDLRAGRYARFTVGDNGHGMDAETVARIFEPFFTTKAPGEGTGLGLSVVHDIVKSNRGSIIVSSRRGEGTTFQVYFRAHAGNSEAAETAGSDRPGVAGGQIRSVGAED